MTTTTTTEAVIKALAERLTIEIDFKEGGTAYYDSGSHTLKVKLLLDDEVISESTAYLPNESRGSEF